MEKTALFLDFDGVICDSAVESFTMSWYAYHFIYINHNSTQPPAAVPVRQLRQFISLRPYVRDSEDNMVIQTILNGDRTVQMQDDFNTLRGELGRAALEKMREAFYQARSKFLADNREFWLGLNPLYPGIGDALIPLKDNPAVYILSTKQPRYIVEILGFNGIPFPGERILEARKRSKTDIIRETIDRTGMNRAFFIDDQIDHLKKKENRRITPCLAEWGYLSAESRQNLSVPHITLDRCIILMEDFAAGRNS